MIEQGTAAAKLGNGKSHVAVPAQIQYDRLRCYLLHKTPNKRLGRGQFMTKCLWFPYPKECQSGCKGNKPKKTSLEKSRSKIWEGHHFRVAMFTDVYLLHSRFSISGPNVMISRKPPIPLSSLLFSVGALSQVPSAARLVRPGRVVRECRIAARQVPITSDVNQQWFLRGQQKQAQPRVGGNKWETKTMLPRQSQTLTRRSLP